jgi:hypothetical protein
VSGIEAFSSTCAHKRIHLTLRKRRDELLSSEHGKDFAVHLQSIRRHQFVAGDIRTMSEGVDHRPKAGINFCGRSRLLFSFPSWQSSSSQSDAVQKAQLVCAEMLMETQRRPWLRFSNRNLRLFAFGRPREIHNATWLCLMRFRTE